MRSTCARNQATTKGFAVSSPTRRTSAAPACNVTASADLSQARNTADDSLTTLGLMIGVIALIVGGMSIANMMIVTVMERRDEIGLRRALGAAQRIDDGVCRIRASSCSEYCGIAQRIPVKYVEYFVSRT